MAQKPKIAGTISYTKAVETATTTKSMKPFHWDNFRDTTMGRYLFAQEYAFIRRALDTTTPPISLLDVSCGSGRIAQPLDEANFNVVGVDVDSVALGSFQERCKFFPLVRGDTLQLPFANQSFDCLTAIQCSDYFDHRQFLQEANRILSLNGLLLFDALNRNNYKWFLKGLVGRALALPSANLSYREWLQALRNYGFEIEAIEGYNWLPFSRESNSGLIEVASHVERTLYLRRLYKLSPKILISARKCREANITKD